MVLEMGDKWPYNCYFMGCCFQDLFNIGHSILVQFPSSFFFMRFISVYEVHPYSTIDTSVAWKKYRLILSERLDFHKIDSQSIAVHTFAGRILTSLLVDETQQPRYVNLSTNFRGTPFRVEMATSRLKYMYSVLFAFTWRPMLPASYCLLLVM